jgi:hypothetical protein
MIFSLFLCIIKNKDNKIKACIGKRTSRIQSLIFKSQSSPHKTKIADLCFFFYDKNRSNLKIGRTFMSLIYIQ